MEKKQIKVALGMSGGVDSSVAVKLLQDQGYEVVGFFMKLWHDPTCSTSRTNACCDERALSDARRVAEMFGIKFYVVDARAEFKKHVVDYFIDEYKNLRTPNPCVVCNEKIKFDWLLGYAQKLGCEYLATGHYARIENSNDLSITNSHLSLNDKLPNDQINGKWQMANGKFHLLKGKDDNKDQTYFLYRLNQEQLAHILFPIGEYKKPEVREMAKKLNLPVYEKKESQEVCFVQSETYREFLRRYLPGDYFRPGEIVTKEGNVIGRHEGLINYTIGQRKNVSQELGPKNIGDRKALYVTGFDLGKNQLVVGEMKDLLADSAMLENLTWIGEQAKKFDAKIRYRAEAVPASLATDGASCAINFGEPQRAITPGQSVVFYHGDEVLGGGVIAE